MNDLILLEKTVINLTNAQDFLEARAALKFTQAKLKEIAKLADDAALAFIEERGSFEADGVLYCISQEKQTKLREGKLKAAVEAAFVATEGDYDRFCEVLASAPLKYGGLRDALERAGMGAKFDQLYETVIKKSVDGKPIRKAVAVEKRFIKQNNPAMVAGAKEQT